MRWLRADGRLVRDPARRMAAGALAVGVLLSTVAAYVFLHP